jgi:hypothetical protein
MLTYLLMSLRQRWRVVTLMIVALLAIPSFAHAVTVSAVIEMFKYSYGVEKMVYLASVETVLWNLLKRKKKQVGGRGQWIIPFQTQNGGVIKGAAEGGTLTTQRAQPDTAEALHSLVEFHAVWDVTWKMLRMAARGADAFETAMNFMDTSIRRRVFRVLNAHVCSYRGVGELAILPAADNQTTVTVNSLPFMDQGMIVDVMDATDDTTKLASAQTVTDVNVQTREFTYSPGAALSGSAAGDYVVVEGQVASSVSYSLNGLGSWLDSSNPAATKGNLGGINRSTTGNRFYQGNNLSNSGTLRAFTEDLLIDGENLCRERGGVQPSRYCANGNILKRYHGECIKDRYFTYNSIQPIGAGGEKVGFGRQGMDLDNSPDGTGETPYTISGKPFHMEPYMPANRIYGWNDDHFFIGHDGIEVPTPLSEIFDDMVSYFTMTTSTKFDVWHYWEGELLSDNPQAGIQFSDIAES